VEKRPLPLCWTISLSQFSVDKHHDVVGFGREFDDVYSSTRPDCTFILSQAMFCSLTFSRSQHSEVKKSVMPNVSVALNIL
jgi:hypothetical protein